MWRVQLAELNYCDKEVEAVREVVAGGWLTMGPRVEELETRFSEMLGNGTHSVAVSSATAGLHLLLMAAGIGPGDEVIIPGLTFVSDANVVKQLGAKVIFADLATKNDLNVSDDHIVKLITPRTKAVVVVHFGGVPKDLEALSEVCERKGILLIEDAAHSPGAMIGSRQCGTLSDAAFFSFFSNKNIAAGEGGMVTTKDEHLAKFVRASRSHGMSSVTLDRHRGRAVTYSVDSIGLNYRMDEVRAALAIVQLSKLDDGNQVRRELTESYVRGLKNLPLCVDHNIPPAGILSSHHIFTVLLPDYANRAEVIAVLRKYGIQSSIHYPPFHSFAAYKDDIRLGDLPNTDFVCDRTLTLPLHPKMTPACVELVCDTLRIAL